ISGTFVRYAIDQEQREPLGIDYRVSGAQSMPFDDGSFDFATAFMSLMDMADYESALREAHRVVRIGGFLQFSILHPCFLTAERKLVKDDAGNVTAVQISGYFEAIE